MSHIEIGNLLQKAPELQAKLLAGRTGLNRRITSIDINRPGLALTGFYKNLAVERLQVFGRGEHAYLLECSNKTIDELKRGFLTYPFPALAFTHGNHPPECFIGMCEKVGTPLLLSPLSTHDFVVAFTKIVQEELARSTAIHSVLIEVFGIGVLLMGASGIGKSETAIELVERGHRLVADDIVNIKCINDTELFGFASDLIQHHVELRGLGIINVKDLFGVGAIRLKKEIELVIFLEEWNESKDYERLGLNEEYVDILNVKIPRLTIPVRPGRNIPILIETAAMNHRSKKMGYHAARDLSSRINEEIQKKMNLSSGKSSSSSEQTPTGFPE